MTMKNVYYEYEQDLIDSLVEDGIDPDYVQVARLFAETMWTFHWGRWGNDADGEVGLDVEDGKLMLKLDVWTVDNDAPSEESIKPITVTTEVDRFRLPEQQIRSLIHAFLCHEADEKMWFDSARPFHPHTGVTV